MTSALPALVSSLEELSRLLLNYTALVSYAEHNREAYGSYLEREAANNIFGPRGLTPTVLRIAAPSNSARTIVEMTYCRMVDAYLHYVASALRWVFLQDPRTLKSEDTVSVASVLEHGNLAEFIEAYADKKVMSLSYQSIDTLSSFFSKRIGIELLGQDVSANEINRFIATRNIIVHNGGLVNDVFVQRCGSGIIGSPVLLTTKDILDAIGMLGKSALDLDMRLERKFRSSE